MDKLFKVLTDKQAVRSEIMDATFNMDRVQLTPHPTPMAVKANTYNGGDRFRTSSIGTALAYADYYRLIQVERDGIDHIDMWHEASNTGFTVMKTQYQKKLYNVYTLAPIYQGFDALFGASEAEVIGRRVAEQIEYQDDIAYAVRRTNSYREKKAAELEPGAPVPFYLRDRDAVGDCIHPTILSVMIAQTNSVTILTTRSSHNAQHELHLRLLRDYRKTLWRLNGLPSDEFEFIEDEEEEDLDAAPSF
jgi:hypothetical protein